ncbi:MAG: type II toxin-antitoxin system death-on-curing family toxin [Collimonas sp.]|uniref:type II toxin-antitoxin system death-on-curing family toxin n=1 Tax=Collimonas sp. TaxID=1963772 RepID=UPI0032656F27
MSSWRWIRADLVYAVHESQLARHGGLDGIRDKPAVESALARPEQLDAYDKPAPDVADLAAAYAYGIAHNHGFSDGNKRTAWVVARVFLADNGIGLSFTAIDAIRAMEAVAAGSLSEKQLAEWFRQRIS